MSTIPNSLSVSAGQTPTLTGPSSPAAQTQGTGFNQTLVQVMGTGQSTAVPQGITALPAQMLADVGGLLEEEGASTELLEVLPDLLKELDQLDDLLESNPELFSTLQAWVAEVQQFLNGSTGGAEEAASGEMSASVMSMDTLAQHPATIRFALQDGLAQLINIAASDAADEQKTQAATLLKSLQTITEDAGAVSDEVWNKLSQAVDNAAGEPAKSSSSKMDAIQARTTDHSDIVTASALKGLQNGQSAGQGGDGSNPNAQAGQTPAQGKGDVADQVVLEQTDTAADAFQLNNVTTAGELAIKNNGTAPAVHESPVVHVRHFAKEMTEFVVQKLDIVKQNGFSEATIMLRPEHLGQLEVKLSMTNGQLVAQFMTDHLGAKDLLEQQMSHLRASLHSQGIQVNKVEVTHNESLSSHLYQQDQGTGANQQQQERRSRTRGKEENEDTLKAAEMAEELRTWTREQRLNGTGQSSFNAQA